MTIETKYNIGDKVSYRPLNPLLSSVSTGEICGIYAAVLDNGIVVSYLIDGNDVSEDNIFGKYNNK